MANSTRQKVLTRVATIGLMVGGIACSDKYDEKILVGNWECQTPWTWEQEDGTSVPCSVKTNVTGQDGQYSATGMISLGDAQWDETSDGTYRIDGAAVYTTRSSYQTNPKNDAARAFERERLDGKRLSSAHGEKPKEEQARIITLTETEFIHVNAEGRTTTCHPLPLDKRTL